MNSWDIRVLAGSYTVEDGKVVIDLFGRTLAGEVITARIRDFLPYFYIVEPTEDILEELKADPEVLNIRDVDLEIEGEIRKCVKVTIQFPFKVPEYRNRYKIKKIILAADIPFIHRFYYDFNLPSCIRVYGDLVDKKASNLPRVVSEQTAKSPIKPKSPNQNGSTNDKPQDKDISTVTNKYTTDSIVEVKKIEPISPFKPNLKILSFDIENSIKDSTIFCICCAYRNDDGEVEYQTFTGLEAELIKEFAGFIQEFDPDVITGYNIDNFDIPVILERASKNNLGALLVGRDQGKFYRVGSTRFWRLHGRVIADAWWKAKMELRPKKETLNYISQLLFNETKDDVDPKKIDEEWANDKEKVIKYCSRDAELALRILEKIAVMDKAMDLASVSKLPLEDAFNSGSSTLIDSILIREADKNAIGVPCTRRISKSSKIEGGYVHTLKSGLYSWVCVLDFKSMYPSIIIANNICFTTINSSGSIKSPTGIRFLAADQRKGILPQILEQFMDDREDAKNKMKTAADPEQKKYYSGLQDAIKILMNSVYGVFASDFYRFTDPKIGASITAFARKNIKDIIKKLETENYDVIYSDTDSIFLDTNTENQTDAIKFGNDIANRFTKGGRVLEFEGIFERFFTHGKKKRYVGSKVYPNEELVIRGYETRRTDAFDLQSEALTNMFKLVLSGKNDELISYARKTITDVKLGEVPVEKLVISKTVKNEAQYKDPNKMANVLAMRKLRELGYEFVPGMKVSYLVTNGHHVPQEVEPYIDGREVEIKPDWDYYAERMALTMSRITEGIDADTEWDSKALLTGVQQKSLFSDTFTQSVNSNPEDKSFEEDSNYKTGERPESESLDKIELQEQVGKPTPRKKGKTKDTKKKGGIKLEDFL
jgi:DNA polymerase I